MIVQQENVQYGQLGIIGQRGCEALIEKVDGYLRRWDVETGGTGQSFAISASCPRFSTGEGKGIINQSVRGMDLYLLSDCFNYGVTYKMYGMELPMSPDDHYQDMKRIIAATTGKARRITVIMPMLYEGRQHRRFGRESLDCAVALQELLAMGVENIITFDAHDPRVQNAIPCAGLENVQPTYQMIRELIRQVPDIVLDPDHLAIVSPDEGGMSRCIYYASVMELNLGMFYKRRDYTRIVNGRNPILSHEYLGDSLDGKDIIVVDDMISSGESMLSIAEHLKERGANRVFIFSSFGLFTDGLAKFDEYHKNGLIERVFTTNLVYRTPELLARPWYAEVDMSKYIAYIINTLNCDHSISHLLDPVQRIHKVLDDKRAGVVL